MVAETSQKENSEPELADHDHDYGPTRLNIGPTFQPTNIGSPYTPSEDTNTTTRKVAPTTNAETRR